MKIFIYLSLVIIPSILADVPTGCATIKSVESGKYLAADTKTQGEKLKFIVGKNDGQEQWEIGKGDEGYTVMHKKSGEFMMAFGADFDSLRSMFSVKPETTVHTKNWKIEPVGEHYSISNVKHPGCLHIGEYDNAYTKDKGNCSEDQYMWEIKSC
uniref:15.4 kDa salivary peptide n=1 Tax=Culex quinquefasciatus TaxID=7176 RepID=Q6TS25_CULQU|nr:15.4 kDa salivary peptide [Culex quinquefasciatus]